MGLTLIRRRRTHSGPAASGPLGERAGAHLLEALVMMLALLLTLIVLALAAYTVSLGQPLRLVLQGLTGRSVEGPRASRQSLPLRPAPHAVPDRRPERPLPEATGSASSADTEALLPLSAQSPLWGEPGALVTVVLFGDLNCPFTRHALRTLLRLKLEMPLDLRLAFKHRPVTVGGASLASFAGKLHERFGAPAFWRLLSSLSRRTEPLTGGFETEVAGDLALDERELVAVARDTEPPVALSADEHWAMRYSVRKTPTWFINGWRLQGVITEAQLRALIDSERRAQLSALATGVERELLYQRRVESRLVGLGADPPERSCVPWQDAPVRALSATPAVTIVEFSDFECGYCDQLRTTLAGLGSALHRELRHVWRSFPLEAHEQARVAANLALHAHRHAAPDTFWQLYQGLYGAHDRLGPDTYPALLTRLGLDSASYLKAAVRGDHDQHIDADIRLGEQLGVSGVPTLFINGRKLEGAHGRDVLARLIREELVAMQRISSAGQSPDSFLERLCVAR